jgi:hypothetical protein
VKDTKTLRKGDFWTSLILFAVSVAMIATATTFPMTDSYGGVQNVWYVSPALFPLIVGGVLVLLSAVLFVNAVVSGGARDALASLQKIGGRLADRDIRLILIVALISAYVYALIPRVDHFIGTALFLQAFILSFYGDRADLTKSQLGGFFTYSVVVGGMALFGLSFERASSASIAADVAGIIVFIVLAVAAYLQVSPTETDLRRRIRLGLIVSVAVPLVLCPAFKYLLLVPLPTEGIVIRGMDTIRYAIRALVG